MKGEGKKFVKFLSGADKRFVIPVFQRNYDWTIRNCEQLYNDLIKIITEKRPSHFFGSIVSVYNPDGDSEEYQIIDGQQRITTTTLLLLAMYNLMREGIVTPQNALLKKKIWEHYLVDIYTPNSPPKLRPIKRDQAAFDALFDAYAEHIDDSNITINYNYFCKRIPKAEITIDELFFAIEQLGIINITLNQDDNPQLVFESLNSTGLALTESDKVRNYLLMGEQPEQQEKYYSTYWLKIENFTEDNLDAFIRDYLSVKQLSTPTMGKVYFAFKQYAEENNLQAEDLLADLLKYARFYKILLGTDKNQDHRINACIYRLNRLETAPVRPFFLEILRIQEENKIKTDDVFQIFRFTENYIFRRLMCEIATNALNKIFLRLHNEIKNLDGTLDNYLNKFYYVLLAKQASGKFPDDNEFAQSFSTRPVYKMAWRC